MNINSWHDTWGAIDWENEPEEKILQKIKEFYHAGVDFNMTDHSVVPAETPLVKAARSSTVKVLDLLVSGGANIAVAEYDFDSVLHYAARAGKIENMKYLIEHSPRKYELKGWYGFDLLCSGALFNKTKVVEYLLDLNPSLIKGKRRDGTTLLNSAAFGNAAETIRFLVKKDPDLIKVDGVGSFGCAVSWGNTEAVKALIDAGVDVNTQDSDGETALHVAAHKGYASTVKALIERGADTKIRNKKNETALSVARGIMSILYILNAKAIRGAYLATRPIRSLRKTLSSASLGEKTNKLSLFKKSKTK